MAFYRVFIPESNQGGDQATGPTADVYCGGALLPAYVCSRNSNRYQVYNLIFSNYMASFPLGAYKGFQMGARCPNGKRISKN